MEVLDCVAMNGKWGAQRRHVEHVLVRNEDTQGIENVSRSLGTLENWVLEKNPDKQP